MKRIYTALRFFIIVIALLVFAAGIVFTFLGAYDFVVAFSPLISNEHIVGDQHKTSRLIAVGLLHAVDLFLIAIVFFVLSLGINVLFNDPEVPFPVKLPEWLRLKNLIQLKAILWEAILTTLVVAYLARMVERSIQSQPMTIYSLVIPGGILLIALSLYFLKKGEE
jgi:uncharacterized membrane protein YqhA